MKHELKKRGDTYFFETPKLAPKGQLIAIAAILLLTGYSVLSTVALQQEVAKQEEFILEIQKRDEIIEDYQEALASVKIEVEEVRAEAEALHSTVLKAGFSLGAVVPEEFEE